MKNLGLRAILAAIALTAGGCMGQALPGTTTFDTTYLDLTFKLDPSTSFKPDTEYLVTISGDLKDASGAAFGSSVSWSFTTGGAK